MQEALNDLEGSGILNREQAALLRRIYGRELMSVHWELRMLLYAGILILTTDLGLLIAKYFASIGHVALLATIALGSAGCFAYCLRRGGGFSPETAPTPDAAYDYVLLLGCLLFGSFQGYLELRYQLLAQHWSWWLLGSGLLYLLCAHYFDNRLVLSLSLSTLGAWLGVIEPPSGSDQSKCLQSNNKHQISAPFLPLNRPFQGQNETHEPDHLHPPRYHPHPLHRP